MSLNMSVRIEIPAVMLSKKFKVLYASIDHDNDNKNDDNDEKIPIIVMWKPKTRVEV